MITILEGEATALDRSMALLSPNALTMPCPDAPGRSWNGFRGALRSARSHLGATRFDAMMDHHAPLVSLLLPNHPLQLSDAARRMARTLRARLTSHLSHNWAIRRGIFEAAGVLLADLADETGMPIYVVDMARLDWASAESLRHLCRLRDNALPRIVVGFDPRLAEARLDERGICWSRFPLAIKESVFALRSPPETEVWPLAQYADRLGDRNQSGEGPPAATVEWEGDLETLAFRALADEAPLGAEAARTAAAAQMASFRRFGFLSALRIGNSLLERMQESAGASKNGSLLDAETRAGVHGIVALSAHNRQFHTADNAALAAFIERHLKAAFDLEPRPDRRAAIAYRLAVTTGRRQGRLEDSLGWCDRGRTVLRTATLPATCRAHLDAWISNIRSYALMRDKRLAEAIAESKAGFAAMAAVAADDNAEPMARERLATRSLLAHNCALLVGTCGDYGAYTRWRRRGTDIELDQPGAARYEAGYWISWHRWERRIDLALPTAIGGLRSARAEHDVEKIYHLGVEAADLANRLGKIDEADAHYRAAAELRVRLGDPEELTPIALSSVPVLVRAGRLTAARQTLEEHRRGETAPTDDPDVLMLLAWVAAEEGDGAGAEAYADHAIACVVATGNRDAMIRMAAGAAELNLRRGCVDDAVDAARRALALAGVSPEIESPASPRLRAHLVVAEHAASESDLAAAIALVPKALEDAETWWRLPRLVALIAHRIGHGGTSAFGRRVLDWSVLDGVALGELIDAAGQRVEAEGELGADLALIRSRLADAVLAAAVTEPAAASA